MISNLSRTALWYVPDDRGVLYIGFGYIARDSRLPHASLGLPDRATLEEVNAAVCRNLAQCAQCMAPVLLEIAAALAESEPDALRSKSFNVLE